MTRGQTTGAGDSVGAEPGVESPGSEHTNTTSGIATRTDEPSAASGGAAAGASVACDKDKETLEREKLQAEIDEIELRVRDQPVQRRLEKFRVYPTYIGVFSTLFVGVVTFALQWSQYLDQREQEQRFKVNEALIKLVKQLDDTSSPALQRSAALELALFGRPAVPLLLEQIDIQPRQPVRDAIVSGLVQVARAEDDAGAIIQSVVDSTVKFVDRELAKPRPGKIVVERHLSSLAKFMELTQVTKDRPPKLMEKVSQKLQSWREVIQSKGQLKDDEKLKLDDVLSKALQKLN